MTVFTKNFAIGSAAAVFALGLSTQVSAAPVFTVDPTVIGNPARVAFGDGDAPFQSDFINGGASTLVSYDPNTDLQTGVGYLEFGSFAKLGGGNLGSATSGLGSTYQMWVEFEYTAQTVSGSFGEVGSISDILSLNFEWYVSTNEDNGDGTTSFTQAGVDGSGDGIAVSVTRGLSSQLVATGELLSGAGGAVINGQGGAGFNSKTTFETTAFGNTFFTEPKPFYNVSFNNFNQTGQGITPGNNVFAVNSANGGVDFNGVPEPATLALVGLGMMAMGASVRRRNRA